MANKIYYNISNSKNKSNSDDGVSSDEDESTMSLFSNTTQRDNKETYNNIKSNNINKLNNSVLNNKNKQSDYNKSETLIESNGKEKNLINVLPISHVDDNIVSKEKNQNLKENEGYHDYINQTYTDISRRQSHNSIDIDHNNLPTNSMNKNEIQSPSSWNSYNILRNPNNRLSLQESDRNSILTTTPNDIERHVQFLSENVPGDNIIFKKTNCGDNVSYQSASSSSEEDECSQYSETRAPDGGWGWVVVFAAFMINLIADGITFSFGVIFVEFLNYFGEGKAKTAWIGSLFMAIPLLSGPIASFLTDRYGCRKVTIVGSILSCIGFVLSAFSNSMELLFLTFGVLAGFGLSLCYVAAVVIVAYYFEKRRSFATGLSVCGSGIGTFIFAPLTQFLLEQYGWRGTTLILAGVFLNMIIFGLLMRDLEWTTHKAKQQAKQKQHKKLILSSESFSISNSTNTAGTASNSHQQGISATDEIKSNIYNDTRLFSSLVTLPTFLKNGEKVSPEVLELLTSHKNVQTILKNYPNLTHSRSFSEQYSKENVLNIENNIGNQKHTICSPENDNRKEESVKIKNLLAHNRPHPSDAYLKDLRIHRHSLTYRGAMLNINRYRLRASSCPDIYRNSMTTIAKEKTYWYQGVDEFKNLFLDILDFSYFSDIRFLLFATSNFLLYTWYDVPYVYLTDYAIELGIEETDASILIGIIGIVNMFGEIFLGWIGDRKGISPGVVYAGCMALCGAFTAIVPLYNSYTWLCAVSGMFGLFIAANYSLTSIILVELITIEKFTNAYGLLLLVQGVANLIGPPLAGWFYDVTGSYDMSFYIAGIFIALSGAILLIVPGLGKYRKYRALKRKNGEEINTERRTNMNVNIEDSKNNCNGIRTIKESIDKV